MLRWNVGNVTVTRIVETVDADTASMIFPDVRPADLESVPWLKPHFVDEQGRMVLSIHALLIESAGKRILVDTCLGNDKERPLPAWYMRKGPFLEDLAAAGASRESIDPERGRATRLTFLERCADRRVLVIGTHFTTPTAGHVVRDGATFRFAT